MEGASNPKRSRNQGKKAADLQTEYLGPSYIDLPKDILVKIFLNLSVMSIFVCKSVCKMWYDIVSDHSFAVLHLSQARMCPLLRCSGATLRSRLLYLVQPAPGDFEHKLSMCDHEYPKARCFCDIRVKLETKFKLPVRNLEKILIDGSGEQLKMRNLESGGGKLKRKDHMYGIVNSCNGLLCLCDPIMNNAIIVCNPVTGEFVNLPESEALNGRSKPFNSITCGFGYSPMLNQYKVIRMFTHYIQEGNGFGPRMISVSEVNVLGTNTWKNIGPHPHSVNKKFPTYSNGCVFWLVFDRIVVFGIRAERFKSISRPPRQNLNGNWCDSMGMLGRDLFITDHYADNICIWIKKDFPSNGNWIKIFSTNLSTGVVLWPQGVYQPLKYLNNGAILMFHAPTNAFIYKDPRKPGFKYLKVRGVEAKLEVIPHIPSFISLKEILSGSDMQVLNVKSRCAELNLHDETKVVSLVEERLPHQ